MRDFDKTSLGDKPNVTGVFTQHSSFYDLGRKLVYYLSAGQTHTSGSHSIRFARHGHKNFPSTSNPQFSHEQPTLLEQVGGQQQNL